MLEARGVADETAWTLEEANAVVVGGGGGEVGK